MRGASFNGAKPSRERLGGAPLSNTDPLKRKANRGAAVGEKNTYRGWGKRPRKPPRR